jgi:hypothetical protein
MKLTRGTHQRPPARLDILNAYYQMLEKSPAYFNQYEPRNTLEAVVKNSIIFALENPDSGEAHRIWNRLIGKPRETSININAEAQLTQSGLFLALGEIRKQFEETPSRTVEIEGESVLEVDGELQAEKGQNDEPGQVDRGAGGGQIPEVVEGQGAPSSFLHEKEAGALHGPTSGEALNVRLQDGEDCDGGLAEERPPSPWDSPPPKAALRLQKKLQEKGAKRFFQ